MRQQNAQGNTDQVWQNTDTITPTTRSVPEPVQAVLANCTTTRRNPDLAYAKDKWTDVVKDEHGNLKLDNNGRPVRVRNERWGKGKRWLGCWLDPEGKEKSAAFDKKVDAEKHAKAMETDAARGAYVDPAASKVLVGTLLDSLLRSKRVERSSLDHYQQVARLHVRPAFGNRQVRSITATSVRNFVSDLEEADYGTSTVKVSLELLQCALDLAVEDEAIRKNPARSSTVTYTRRKASKIVPWTRSELQGIIDGHPERYQLIPTVGMSCGPRPNELFALIPEDFDDESGVLHIDRQLKRIKNKEGRWMTVFGLPKYGKTREATLPTSVGNLVRDYMKVFPPQPVTLPWEDPDGDEVRTFSLVFAWAGPITRNAHVDLSNYTKVVWCPALVHAGLMKPPTKGTQGRHRYEATGPNKPHAWRHYFASDSLQRLVPITSVSSDLGHASTKVTFDVYAHLMPDAHGVSMTAGDARLANFTLRSLTDQ
jgi:integrase